MIELNAIYNSDCLTFLKSLPDNYINCCVTSPPYYGLRDYGVDGQIGLEETPEAYVEKMVAVFREVRRVLKDDGTLFLNLGDSYYGSKQGRNGDGSIGKINSQKQKSNVGAQRAVSCGTSDKGPEDYPTNDSISESLCGVCRRVSLHTIHTDDLLVPMLIASLSWPTPEHREFVSDHFPTLDFSRRVSHILNATHGFLHSQSLAFGQINAFHQSMPTEFFRQLLVECLRRGSSSSCLLCGHSLISYENPNGNKLGEFLKTLSYNQDNALPYDQQENHNQYINKDGGCYDEIFSYYTHIKPQCTNNNHANLKPKDLIGIPWMVAFALRADGWYLRQDIIWHKPNPMPESVTDRCTKAHEYVFLMSKSARYYYDADAIKTDVAKESVKRLLQNIEAQKGSDRVPGKSNGNMKAVVGNFGGKKGRETHIEKGDPNYRNGHEQYGRPYHATMKANKKSVWVVPTMPFSEAHFATFPEDLIVPCIKAGCPEEGIVLDPFMGAGTTALVAHKLNRNYIGSELNPEYCEIAEKRLLPYKLQQKLF